jgi:hypothetical protein
MANQRNREVWGKIVRRIDRIVVAADLAQRFDLQIAEEK